MFNPSKVKGATGIKIVGRGDEMDRALAGLPLYIARRDDEVEYFKDLLERLFPSLASFSLRHFLGRYHMP